MRGRVNFYSIGEKDNLQIVSAGTDIWDGPTSSITIPPSGGEQMQLVSSNVEDSITGTGIRSVRIYYLDSLGIEQTVETDTNGGTVDLAPLNIRFIQYFHATAIGDNTVSVGTLSIRSKNIAGNPVYQVIKPGGNMSLCINKMVPANKTFYLTQWHASASGKAPVTVRLRSTDNNLEVFNTPNYVFLFKDTASFENSSFTRTWPLEEAIRIPELSIIKVSAWTTQAGANVSAGFGGELKSNQ